MKFKLALKLAAFATLALGLSSAAVAVDITGAGATFPYPIYAKWAEAYKAKTGTSMNYQSIGSGGGIKQIQAKTVDFGASDKPLKPEELDKHGLMQFPAVMGGVVPVINLAGISAGQIKLNGTVLADIFLGKIKKWNDPAIVALNKDAKLPDERHYRGAPFRRFRHHLHLHQLPVQGQPGMERPRWARKPRFPGRPALAAKATRAWRPTCKQIKGSIGYVEYAYALQNKMNYAQLQNKDGQFVKPDEESFKAAAANAQWDKAPGFYEILTDEPGKASWPITGATFILMHKVQDKPANAAEVLKFFDWAYTNGGKMALDMDYIPMPDSVVKLVKSCMESPDQGCQRQGNLELIFKCPDNQTPWERGVFL